VALAKRIWVIDPSLEHAEDEGVREILDGWSGEHRVFHPGLRADGPGPETGHDTDGVVLMGSAASVHDDRPWISRLSEWLRPLLAGERPIPLLAICFGHQLVGHLAGSGVGFVHETRRKVLGVQRSTLEGGRLLPGRRELRVIASHCEEVREPPAGYRVVARRSAAPLDGLEHRELPIFTFQFHPEAREEFARHAGIDPAAIDAELRADNRLLLEAFRRRVRTGAG
jgi:GMP synthase-like glutamine amidotransferase